MGSILKNKRYLTPFSETNMNEAYLLMGGNVGDRLMYLKKAAKAIENYCGKITATSDVYETEAWGTGSKDNFLNQALAINTNLSAEELMPALLEIEESLGRKRSGKYGPRTIDLDILLFNNEIIKAENLVIPHPELQNRRFALQCLTDIAAEKIHPLLQRSISELLTISDDPLKVNKYY
jgi:2-amino-4-hydroxy-6-hydroxymethyldihydropteridine diphosphokinase